MKSLTIKGHMILVFVDTSCYFLASSAAVVIVDDCSFLSNRTCLNSAVM